MHTKGKNRVVGECAGWLHGSKASFGFPLSLDPPCGAFVQLTSKRLLLISARRGRRVQRAPASIVKSSYKGYTPGAAQEDRTRVNHRCRQPTKRKI